MPPKSVRHETPAGPLDAVDLAKPLEPGVRVHLLARELARGPVGKQSQVGSLGDPVRCDDADPLDVRGFENEGEFVGLDRLPIVQRNLEKRFVHPAQPSHESFDQETYWGSRSPATPAVASHAARAQPEVSVIFARRQTSGGHGTRTRNRLPGTTFPVSPLAIRLPSDRCASAAFASRATRTTEF